MADMVCKFEYLESKDAWILTEGHASHCDAVKPTDPPEPGGPTEVNITVATGPGGTPDPS